MDGNGAEFYKSGNTLYITQTGDISESTVFKATRNLPSAASSTFNIWYMSGSTYQTTVSLPRRCLPIWSSFRRGMCFTFVCWMRCLPMK